MTPQEIYSRFFEPNKRILHIGCGDRSLKELSKASEYIGVGNSDPADIKLDLNSDPHFLPTGFDYVVLDEILEVVDDPIKLIMSSKGLGEKVVIYEYKHHEPTDFCKEHWKKPWHSIGLENLLVQNFDLVNNVFLGYATIHFCSQPYTPKEGI